MKSLTTENKVASLLERTHMTKKRRQTVVINEDLNQVWCADEIKMVAKAWDDGESIESIAGILSCEPDEVVLIIIHLARRRKIKRKFEFVKNKDADWLKWQKEVIREEARSD